MPKIHSTQTIWINVYPLLYQLVERQIVCNIVVVACDCRSVLKVLHKMNSYRIWHQNIYFDRNYFPTFEEVPLKRLKRIKLKVLKANTKEYNDVKSKMRMEDIEIIKIIKINNGYLHRSYELKRDRKQMEFERTVEVYAFHGTNEICATGIRTNNFNWRFFGQTSHRWYNGKGVYFSNDATISRTYPRKCTGTKIMFLVKVLVQNFCRGYKYMNFPPQGIDTTVSENANEIVKYEDNEFYPCYQIIFNIVQHPMNENLSLDSAGFSTNDVQKLRGQGLSNNDLIKLIRKVDSQSQSTSMEHDFATSEDSIEIPSLSISSFLKSDLVHCSNYDEDLYDETSTDEESEDDETNHSAGVFAGGRIILGKIIEIIFNIFQFFQGMVYPYSSVMPDETSSDSDSY